MELPSVYSTLYEGEYVLDTRSLAQAKTMGVDIIEIFMNYQWVPFYTHDVSVATNDTPVRFPRRNFKFRIADHGGYAC